MTEIAHDPLCPQCQCPHCYHDGTLLICPECFHEWHPEASSGSEPSATGGFVDAHGTSLVDGDAVVTVKDLKMGKDTLKSGTKVKNIRLLAEPVNGHDIACKVDGFGSIYLKCSVVKKAKG